MDIQAYIHRQNARQEQIGSTAMTRNCEEDGTIGEMACDYYGSRARGGFGIVITEIAAVDERDPECPTAKSVFG